MVVEVRREITCAMGVGRAFSPLDFWRRVLWAAGSGWYEIATLAAGNRGVLEGLRLDGDRPTLPGFNRLCVNRGGRWKSCYLEALNAVLH